MKKKIYPVEFQIKELHINFQKFKKLVYLNTPCIIASNDPWISPWEVSETALTEDQRSLLNFLDYLNGMIEVRPTNGNRYEFTMFNSGITVIW